MNYLLIFLLLLIFILIFMIYYYYSNCFENFETPIYNPDDLKLATMKPGYNVILNDYLLANTQELIPTTNDFRQQIEDAKKIGLNKSPMYMTPSPIISPIMGIASQTSLMNQLKIENNLLKLNSAQKRNELQRIKTELNKIKQEILQKEKDKARLSADIADINNNRTMNNTVLTMIIRGIDATLLKEQQLKNKEKELEDKKQQLEKLLLQPIPTLPPVEIKQEQIKPLQDKLTELEKRFNEINSKIPDNICNENNIPEPQKESFMFDPEITKNPSYNWCMCNDNNKKGDCIDYMDCSKNYLKNKDKTSIIGDDLTLYMKCLSRYPNFPRYLSENNKNKGVSIQ